MGGSTEQGMFAEERKSRIIEFINKNEKDYSDTAM